MSVDPNRFTASTKTNLSKRAGYICSNPHCKSPTSGPHSDSNKAISVGEAAHIRGANPTSARYHESMTPEERRSIINGIWLCRTCAGLIDTDERRYTVDLLYSWKFEHESALLAEIEKAPGEKEQRARIVSQFAAESLAARQIALDQPEHWEYLLIVELLRDKFGLIKRRFHYVEKGFEYKPSRFVAGQELVAWFREKLADIQEIVSTLSSSALEELTNSCGRPGVPSDPISIRNAANLLASLCDSLVEWERDVKYTLVPDDLNEVKVRMLGWTKDLIREMDGIPEEISTVFSSANPEGLHVIQLVFNPPPGMTETSRIFTKRLRRHLS